MENSIHSVENMCQNRLFNRDIQQIEITDDNENHETGENEENVENTCQDFLQINRKSNILSEEFLPKNDVDSVLIFLQQNLHTS